MIEKLTTEIKLAMKAKDKPRLTTLRGVKSEADSEAKKEVRETTSGDVETAVIKGIKQRNEAIKIYNDKNRSDLADIELAEVDILKEFLPEQLTDEAITEIVNDAIATLGATTKKDMGKVMGYVNSKIAKGSADGKLIAGIVGHKLS